MTATSPQRLYQERESQHLEAETRFRSWNNRLSWLRLVVFVWGLVTAWLVVQSRALGPLWLLPPVAAFGALLVIHERVIRRQKESRRRAAFYSEGLARISGEWAGKGVGGEEYQETDHPYSFDLDLFGDGSLFELLCTARTLAGERALASWLNVPTDGESIARRQKAVQELSGNLDLREEVSLLGEEVRSGLHPRVLAEWAAGASWRPVHLWTACAFFLSALLAVAVVGWFAGAVSTTLLLFAAIPHTIFVALVHRRVEHVVGAVGLPSQDLHLLSGMLARFEGERLRSPLAGELQQRLVSGRGSPSIEINRLQKLVTLLDARRNQLFAPVAHLLLWSYHLAARLESWRRVNGPRVAGWLEALGELEALLAVAGYTFENGGDPLPDIGGDEALLDAQGIAHPLLSPEDAVPNDLKLDGKTRVLMVSGSNMSGKSTLLRTVGVNVVLASLGAPVRARSLKLSPFLLGASITVRDSLSRGRSRFFAEVTRIQQVVELTAGERPVLFLLDEILHGTNSHDRRIGAAAVVEGLIKKGALGLVTTHDLALTQGLGPAVTNVHFQDRLEDGEMVFDYRLRPGVVAGSNALALMRQAGLEV